ncbi:hypothetical protein Tco_0741736 [Tanacetum coccineum]
MCDLTALDQRTHVFVDIEFLPPKTPGIIWGEWSIPSLGCSSSFAFRNRLKPQCSRFGSDMCIDYASTKHSCLCSLPSVLRMRGWMAVWYADDQFPWFTLTFGHHLLEEVEMNLKSG